MRSRALTDALAGALMLAVGMGFGRFAFTGLYPQMMADGVLDLRDGALTASANYAGYLLGALLLAWKHPWQPATLCRVGLFGSLACLLAMVAAQSVASVLPLRFLAGVASALTLVGASLWLLRAGHHPRAAPVLYAGVGLGILLSAELIAVGQTAGWHSHTQWLLLALAALALLLPATRALRHMAAPASTAAPTTPTGTRRPISPSPDRIRTTPSGSTTPSCAPSKRTANGRCAAAPMASRIAR